MRRQALGARGCRARLPHQEKQLEDERRGTGRMLHLADCTLPKGMRLVTARPRQAVVDGQMVWVFVLAYDESAKERWYHQQRFEAEIAEEIQMRWAIREFVTALRDEQGIRVANAEVWLNAGDDEE
jgi:hypothetical protein